MIFKSKAIFVVHPVICLDSQENVVNGRVFSREVVRILSGDKRNLKSAGEINEVSVDIRVMGLDFQIIIITEKIVVVLDNFFGFFVVAGSEEFCYLAREASGETD